MFRMEWVAGVFCDCLLQHERQSLLGVVARCESDDVVAVNDIRTGKPASTAVVAELVSELTVRPASRQTFEF